MAEGGNWEGDSVASTSKKQTGGKLTQVVNVFKRLWPVTSSKNDGQNTGTTTEKQSGIENRTSMECEPAEEEREQCQSRERGIGDVVHAPGTESSDEIHHDRDSSNKESSSPLQGADLTLTYFELLTQWSDCQLFQLTKFYRERLKQAIEEGVESLSFMMRRQGCFSEQEHGSVAELVAKGNRKDSSLLFLSLVMGKGPDTEEYMNIIGGLTELPSHME
ncbi:uncharacterized protein LOC116970332, partial [Amblyraja radiata]|uniref:uncharacterized protein LOC116970332 n=1 Tax=Amblyraja radiata TaxID=386614 RepID=UPI0014026021